MAVTHSSYCFRNICHLGNAPSIDSSSTASFKSSDFTHTFSSECASRMKASSFASTFQPGGGQSRGGIRANTSGRSHILPSSVGGFRSFSFRFASSRSFFLCSSCHLGFSFSNDSRETTGSSSPGARLSTANSASGERSSSHGAHLQSKPCHS